MSEYRFRKRVEIPMHVIAAVYSISISALLVIKQISNPTPNTPPHCNAAPYPYWCDEEECDLLRGTVRWLDTLRFVSSVVFYVLNVSVGICLILTVFWVYMKERSIASLRRDYDVSNDIDVLLDNNLLNTRASFIQAMCYLLVYSIKVLFTLTRVTSGLGNMSRGWQILHCLINPLDGFFNALIFVSIEVHNLRNAEASGDGQKSSLLETLWRVINQGDTTNVAVISHLSIVYDDNEAIVHVKEEDGQISQSKCSIKGDELENFFSNLATDYFTENQSPSAHHLSPSTEGSKVTVKHHGTSASLADGGVDSINVSYCSSNHFSSVTGSPENLPSTQENAAGERQTKLRSNHYGARPSKT
jgi:hypothetical protein